MHEMVINGRGNSETLRAFKFQLVCCAYSFVTRTQGPEEYRKTIFLLMLNCYEPRELPRDSYKPKVR
jgi:hypothetical protein